MCFLKFSRDRRGYEHFYLVEPVTGRRGKTRQRVLYWFRTPPNVKVGREPFDPHVMRALEAQYPGVTFDWQQLKNTPIPSVEPEFWRERRRAERVARQVQHDEDAQAAGAEPPTAQPAAIDFLPQELAEVLAADDGPDTSTPAKVFADPVDGALPAVRGEGPGSRGRRRGRGQRQSAPAGPAVPGTPDQTESFADASIDADDVTNDGPLDSPED